MVLFILFLLIPLIEIYLFIEVGSAIGLWPTLAGVVLTAVVGAYYVRRQGLDLFLRARQKMQTNEIPADEMFSGLCVFLAGAFLLTPGFFTDTLGFLLLIPAVRMFVRNSILDGVLGSFTFGIVDMDMMREAQENEVKRRGDDAGVIDAEFEVVDDETLPRK